MNGRIGIVTGIIVLSAASLAFAQSGKKGQEMMGSKSAMMVGCPMMKDKGMMGMMGMCQSMMNKPSIAPVGDGVVVLTGKKLYKYDSNLNLVKEIEIKLDEMPMMGGMMGSMGANQGGGKAAVPTAGADADEHAAHHPKK